MQEELIKAQKEEVKRLTALVPEVHEDEEVPVEEVIILPKPKPNNLVEEVVIEELDNGRKKITITPGR